MGLGRSIYSKAQVEELMKFQDPVSLPDGDCRAGQRRTWRRQVLGPQTGGASKGGPHRCCGMVPGSPVPSEGTLSDLYSIRTPSIEHGKSDCVSGCASLHHLQGQGHGLWLLGIFWSLPFQLIINSVRRANEATTEVAGRCRDGVKRPTWMRARGGWPVTLPHCCPT